MIAAPALLYAIRRDVEGEATASKLEHVFGDRLKPIAIGPDLINYLDSHKHRDFLQRWQQATVRK